ncbi:beta strand repeat-containing protein, partial [Herbaspirillum rhizosphaerae]|uniref:beta strand repeat-containing protein n=1 Tax=Herbaspirillum rhizosphaerae TaxID=346179 RepID=UPI000AC64ACF
ETSGLKSLDVVNAPTIGAGGTWLIDPYDLEVVSDAVANASISVGGSGPFAVTSAGGGAKIRASSISTWLSQDLNVTLATTGTQSDGGNGNITINAAITKSAGTYSVLTLNADGNIYVNANVTSTSGGLDVNMISNYRGLYNGIQSNQISGATVSLNGGVLNISDGYSGFRSGNLSLVNGAVLNLSYNTSDPNATRAGAVATGNLTVDATSSIVGSGGPNSNLTVNGAYTNNGTLTLLDTAAMNVGTFTNNGNATLTNVTAFSSGGVSNSGNLTLSNASFNVSDSLHNTGTVNLTKSTVWTQHGFYNDAGGTIAANYLTSLLVGQVYNNGTMSLDSTANKPTGYTGDTTITVNGGVTNNGTLNMFGLVNASGGDVNNNGNLTLTGATLTVATLNNNAGGTLSGTGTISPPNAGTSTVTNNGTIAPGGDGTVGTLTINGNYLQNAGGTLLVDIAGAGNNDYDHLNVDSAYSVTLNGTLKTRLLGTYVPTLSQSFQPFGTTTNVSGAFRHVLGDVVNVGGSQQMIKSFVSDSGIFLTMSGSEDITFSGAEGGWGSISNWSTGYFPTAIDNVVVSGGAGLTHIASDGIDIVHNITLNQGASLSISGGTVSVGNIISNGSISVSGTVVEGGGQGGEGFSGFSYTGGGGTSSPNAGVLNVSGTASMTSLSLSNGGTVNGGDGSVLSVTSDFSQTGGSINSNGTVAVSRTEGNVVVGNITARDLFLTTQGGSITQTDALHVKRQLTTTSTNGTTLDNVNNQIAAYTGTNSASGDIVLVNNLNVTDTSVVRLNGLSNAGGNISVDNTGGMVLVGNANTSGSVSLVTHSPLTINGNITAGTGIALAAGVLGSGLPADSIVINGQLNSAGGVISLLAGGSLIINTPPIGNFIPAPPPAAQPQYPSPSLPQQQTLATAPDTTSQLDRSVNNTQTTSASSSTPNTGANPVVDNTQTTGGTAGTFGGDDTESASGQGGTSANGSKKVVKLYCS